jgi:hypothetical protein
MLIKKIYSFLLQHMQVEPHSQPITWVVRFFLFPWHVVVEYPNHCAGLAGNQVLFEKRILKSWEKALCSRPGCTQARKSSSIFSVRGNRILLCTLPLHNAFHSILCSSIAICVVLLPLIATRGQSMLIYRDLCDPFAQGGSVLPNA